MKITVSINQQGASSTPSDFTSKKEAVSFLRELFFPSPTEVTVSNYFSSATAEAEYDTLSECYLLTNTSIKSLMSRVS